VSDIYTPVGGEVTEINAAIDGDRPRSTAIRTVGLVLQGQARRRASDQRAAVAEQYEQLISEA